MLKYMFADDWIWTADFCNWNQPLYQLSHTTALPQKMFIFNFLVPTQNKLRLFSWYWNDKSNCFKNLTFADPTMDSSERINRIQNSLKELRKTYHSVKSELAVIERRRKKIRRKERERAEKGMTGNPVEAAA